MMKNELMHTRTEIFEGLISQVKTACELSGHWIADHFAEVGKMIQLGKGGQLKISESFLNARNFTTEIPIHKACPQYRQIELHVLQVHVTNNEAVRQTSLSRGIRSESQLIAENVKKVERRVTSAEKKVLKNPEGLEK